MSKVHMRMSSLVANGQIVCSLKRYGPGLSHRAATPADENSLRAWYAKSWENVEMPLPMLKILLRLRQDCSLRYERRAAQEMGSRKIRFRLRRRTGGHGTARG